MRVREETVRATLELLQIAAEKNTDVPAESVPDAIDLAVPEPDAAPSAIGPTE